MVWIHGGGWMIGSKDNPVYDGHGFARDGVVLVSMNYRLGVEGFLPIPGVPTNLGLRDMVAALHWVHDNIATFGGDPDNVTVFGESAGAFSIANLIASPLCDNLFRRAIVQSGHGLAGFPIEIAQRVVEHVARYLDIPATRSGFMSVEPGAALRALKHVSRRGRIDLRDDHGFDPTFGISRFNTVYGDDVLPVRPLTALATGAGKDIDLMIGTMTQEANLFFAPLGLTSWAPAVLARWFLQSCIAQPRTVLHAYGLGSGKRPGQALSDAMTDLCFRWPAQQYATAHRGRTFMYAFGYQSTACRGRLGAAHALDIPFVFDNLSTVSGTRNSLAGIDPPRWLAKKVHQHWIDFATTGDPGWAPFDHRHANMYMLDQGAERREPNSPAARLLPPTYAGERTG